MDLEHYLEYYFFVKTNIVTSFENPLVKTVLMSGQNLDFNGEISIVIPKLSLSSNSRMVLRYSRASVSRTLMACLPLLFRTRS